jgi:hypothetical protein
VAKLYQHPDDGTYSTRRYEDGVVTRQIHPDGVVFLKRRGVALGDDIPPFAMAELVERRWLHTPDEAARRGDIDWCPAWETIGAPPVRPEGWTKESSGWSRFEPAEVKAATLALHPGRARWPLWGAGALLVLAAIAALMV